MSRLPSANWEARNPGSWSEPRDMGSVMGSSGHSAGLPLHMQAPEKASFLDELVP